MQLKTRVIGAFLLGMLSSFAAAADSASGSLKGVAVAADGRPLAGATIELRSTSGQSPASTNTSGDGKFQFSNIPAGEYELSVSSNGTEYRAKSRIVVSSDTTVTTELK